MIYLYIFYTLAPWLRNYTDFIVNICLLGSVRQTKNADPNKGKYSVYGIGFDSRAEFLFTNRCMGKSVIVFGADMSLSAHMIIRENISEFLVKDQRKG